MKKILPVSGLLILIAFLITLPFYNKESSSTEDTSLTPFDQMDKLMEQEFMLTRDPKLNRVPRERLLIAEEVRDARLALLSSSIAVPGINWQERGPDNVGGRTRAVWFDRTDAPLYRKVWAAGVGGGLWVTNDITVANPVWTKIDDFFDNLAVTSFVQDPVNPLVMYFGTGEGWFNSDAIQGLGIWNTTDGGVTWSRLNSTANFYFVQDLVIDNNGHLYASVRANSLGAGAAGIQKSTNGGATWTQVLGTPVSGSSSRGADLEVAVNGDLYASLGTLGSNGGIYRSGFAANGANTGNAGTWINITPNTTGVIQTPANFWHRIVLAAAPSSADTLYALFQGNGSSNCTSIQRYKPSTNTWTVCSVPTIIDQGSNSNFARGQAWYDLVAAVDPNNAANIYIAGIDALRSNDAGVSWTQMTTWSLFAAAGFTAAQNVHADHHAIQYVPGSSARALWGTDGGLFYTTNADITGAGAKPAYISKNGGYNVTQYYGCAIHPVTTDYFLAGAQDNGSHRFSTAGLNNVTQASGGDGGFPHIDQDNGNVQITSYVNNNYYVSTNNGSSFTSRSKNNRGGFINPTDYDNTVNILYGGDDAGSYFRWESPETNGADAAVMVTQFGGGSVSHVAVSPVTPNRVFFGLNNGSVVMVNDAHTGVTRTGVIIKPTAAGVVSCVAVDPANENHMLVTSTNYGVDHVFESMNALSGSPTWTVTDGDLPDMPVRWAMFDPRNSDWALLATELGVWSTNNLNGASTAWSPTNSGLANVRVDMLQYRVADRTIAAASHGRGLFTATVPDVTTPDVNFPSAATVVDEQTAATISCRSYRDYAVSMTIANPPTGDATITVNVQAGNTAIQGLDFDYTTNGDFVSPGNSFVFSDGATASHTINVRIYDDAEVELSEFFVLTYSISGTTDAQTGTGSQIHTFTIDSDDTAPFGSSNGNYLVGTYNINLSNGTVFKSNKQKHRIQTLFYASELNAAGITMQAMIDSLTVRVGTKNSTQPYNGFTVSMANTAATTLATGFQPVSFTQVYSGNYNTVVGNNVIPFSTPFAWDGSSNVLIQFCFDNNPAAADALADIMEGEAEPLGTGIRATTYSDYISGATAGCSLPAAFVSDSRLNVSFGASVSGTSPATVLNTSKSEYLGPNSDVYFYSGSGELMARIHNLGSHDYGCTQVVIDRAGTAATAFWNNNTANYLMDKTIRVLPANNNPAGQFEITLYYSEAEVNGWELSTGQSVNSIQLVKLPGQVPDVTPGNPEPDGPGTVQIVDPVRGMLGTISTLTYTFNNGFSGFGAGIPGSTLPVRLLDFTGKLHNNSVVLNWKTASEQNSKVFDIEKSYDGITYTRIGSIAAAGNSSSVSLYQFNDANIAQELNYYRLKQVDLDGFFEYSKIITVKSPAVVQFPFKILGNPVQDNLDLQFGSVPNTKVEIRLLDIHGRQLLTWQNANVQQRRIRIDLSGLHLARGTYVVNVKANGRNYTAKIIK